MANPNLNNESEFLNSAEKEFENTIRPSAINDFSGQSQIIENISIFIKAELQILFKIHDSFARAISNSWRCLSLR